MTLKFAPPHWLEPGFWDDYYDGDPSAAETGQKNCALVRESKAPSWSQAQNSPDFRRPVEDPSAGTCAVSCQGILTGCHREVTMTSWQDIAAGLPFIGR